MLFNSFPFLSLFAVFVAVYYATPHRFRWPLLLAASLGFYATFSPVHVLLLLGITAVAYVAALAIDDADNFRRRRQALLAGCSLSLAVLVFFKYYEFFADAVGVPLQQLGVKREAMFPRLDLLVPVGLSFYTLSAISYVADVYARRLRAERHAGTVGLYLAFFPKLLAGPIERATPFLAQVLRPVPFNAAGVTAGLQLMLWGLVKKVVIADRLALFVNSAYAQPAFASPADLVIATYFFAFQLYCDFSGYSDIAIGAARVLGFDLTENFRRPYLATSVREFWTTRWHISLAVWFRDYLYIPLGGNRRSRVRTYLNAMAVFLASGLWHGANWTFLVWGGLNGLYVVASMMLGDVRGKASNLVRLPKALTSLAAGVVTFHLILITWVFFRAASIADARTILARVAASAGDLPRLLQARMTGTVLLSLGLVVVLLIAELVDERRPMWSSLRAQPIVVRWAVYYVLLIALVVLGNWNVSQFVYMQF